MNSTWENFKGYSASLRAKQREQYEKGLWQDTRPSRRRVGYPAYLNAADRERWHLQVIAEWERKSVTPVTPPTSGAR